MFIGLAGSAFNQSKESEMSFGDSINLGGYKIVCQSYSEDSNANYDSQFALLDVFHNGKKITRLTPERRVYFVDTDHAQPSTIVAIHSTLENDLYVVFEGTNPDNDRPIIKFFINPLVNWIWVGVVIVVFGTFIALVPPLKPSTRRVEVPSPHPATGLGATDLGAPEPALSLSKGLASETWVGGAAKLPASPGAPHV
jgi:cytochrome c-type biogenesis protein CcmF